MSDRVKAIKSLELEDAKIYESKGDKLSLVAKGNLEILYITEFDRFILRLEDFKYILSPKLSTIASLSKEEDCRSYTVPSIEGHYIIKLKSTISSTIIKNLETIFANSSHFSYQQNHEHDLENQVHTRGHHSADYRAYEANLKNKNQPEALAKANKYIKVGGEMLKLKIMRAASYIGQNIGHTKTNSFTFQGPNQYSVKSIEELKGLKDSDSQTVAISRNEINALITLLNEHEKIIANQSYQDIGVRMHPSSENKWPTFKKAAVESAQSFMQGMDDAAGDLAKAIKAKRANIRIPEDKEERIFKKIDQNIKGEAPLPLHQLAPDQQQSVFDRDAKVNNLSQLQNLTSKVRNYFA